MTNCHQSNKQARGCLSWKLSMMDTESSSSIAIRWMFNVRGDKIEEYKRNIILDNLNKYLKIKLFFFWPSGFLSIYWLHSNKKECFCFLSIFLNTKSRVTHPQIVTNGSCPVSTSIWRQGERRGEWTLPVQHSVICMYVRGRVRPGWAGPRLTVRSPFHPSAHGWLSLTAMTISPPSHQAVRYTQSTNSSPSSYNGLNISTQLDLSAPL